MTEAKDIRPEDIGTDADPRSDIEQAVAARSDAVARGEGGADPETFTSSGMHDGSSGTGGVVKNQDDTAQ